MLGTVPRSRYDARNFQNFPSLSFRTRKSECEWGLQTRLGLGLGLDVPGSPSLRLGLGLKVKLSLVSDLELGLISTGFICKMGISGWNNRGSRLKTQNRSRCSNQVRTGLGIGLEIQNWPVSDSASSLENGDSGNSGTDPPRIDRSKCHIGNQRFWLN